MFTQDLGLFTKINSQANILKNRFWLPDDKTEKIDHIQEANEYKLKYKIIE